MELESIWKIVESSECDDWNHIVTWGAGAGPSYKPRFGVSEYDTTDNRGQEQTAYNIAVDGPSDLLIYKDDVDLSIAYGVDRDPHWEGRMKLIFPYQDRFFDDDIRVSYVDLFWRGNLVDRVLHIIVDGGRCRLPAPDEVDGEYVIEARELALARLVNSISYDQTDRYLGQSKFKVIN